MCYLLTSFDLTVDAVATGRGRLSFVMDMSSLLTTPLKMAGILKSSKYAPLYDHLVNIASSRKGQHADLLAALQEMGLSDADAFEYLSCNDKEFVKIVDKFLLKMCARCRDLPGSCDMLTTTPPRSALICRRITCVCTLLIQQSILFPF